MGSRAVVFAGGIAILLGVATACRSGMDPAAQAIPDLHLRDVHPEVASGHGWLNPKTLQLHLDSEKPEPNDVVVRGIVEGQLFQPQGDVEGALPEAPVRGRVDTAWLELRNRRVRLV